MPGSLSMNTRIFVLILAACGTISLSRAQAQQPESPKAKRIVYVVKYGEAKDLASVLTKHFKGDAEVQVLPESPSNCLLISAAPNVFDEVVKSLAQIDKRPNLVSIDILVLDFPAKKRDEGKSPPSEKELDAK